MRTEMWKSSDDTATGKRKSAPDEDEEEEGEQEQEEESEAVRRRHRCRVVPRVERRLKNKPNSGCHDSGLQTTADRAGMQRCRDREHRDEDERGEDEQQNCLSSCASEAALELQNQHPSASASATCAVHTNANSRSRSETSSVVGAEALLGHSQSSEEQRRRRSSDGDESRDGEQRRRGGERAESVHPNRACDQSLRRFRHFGDEWQQICNTLLSCDRLLRVMSSETSTGRTTTRQDDDDSEEQSLHESCNSFVNKNNKSCVETTTDDRQELRQIIRSIQPKKYSKQCSQSSATTAANASRRHQQQQQQCGRRSSYHRLKALTQLLMTSNLKRSTSLQAMSVTVRPTDATDDTTATLPRLRRRPRIARETRYHSLDVSDDNNECNESDETVEQSRTGGLANRAGLSLVLSPSTATTQHVTTSGSAQTTHRHPNRHSCDVTSLLLSPTSQNVSQTTTNGRQVLKYSKKRLRGPYGEMLESMMKSVKTTGQTDCADAVHSSTGGGGTGASGVVVTDSSGQACERSLSERIETLHSELLRQTQKQRNRLDDSARETTGTAVETTATTTGEAKETTPTTVASITATIGRHLDTRTHIVGELYDTEKSFCEQLRDLTEKYARPLHEQSVIDSLFVEIIFGKIPEILLIHSKFLEELRNRIKNWSPMETTVGDLFDMFEEKSCFDVYLSFVDNWFESKQLIKNLSREKPQFQKFLAEQSHKHRSKLSLDELMISIVQRIPRFELLLKQLLKNTGKEHKDFDLLHNALKKIHSLVLYINRVNKNDSQLEISSQSSSLSSTTTSAGVSLSPLDVSQTANLVSVTQLESIVDGLPSGCSASASGAVLHSICFVVIRKRERILLLFDSLLVISALKGKKKSEKFEENKYKVLNHFSLDLLDVKSSSTSLSSSSTVNESNDCVVSSMSAEQTTGQQESSCLELLERDLQIVQTMQTSFLSRLSPNSKHFLESVFAELNQNICKRMTELRNCEKNLELIIKDRPPPTQTTAADHCSSATNTGSSGQQFYDSSTTGGGGGQQTTPGGGQSELKNSISLQFASQELRQKFEKIFKQLKEELKQSAQNAPTIVPQFLCFLPIRKTRAGLQFTCASPTIGTNDVWICNSDGFVGQISVLSLNWSQKRQNQNHNHNIEPTIVSCNGVCNSRIICMTCVPKSTQTPNDSCNQNTSEESDLSNDSDCGETQSDSNAATTPTTTSGRSRRHKRTDSMSSTNKSALCSATMWFGTDDSSVHIYSCFDAIRIKKNKVKVALSAKVEAIAHFKERVFVSLSNHSVAVFQRDPLTGDWQTTPVVRENMSCFRFCCVRFGQQLWTCAHSSTKITVRDVDLNALYTDIPVDDIQTTTTTTTTGATHDDDDHITHMVCVDANERVFVTTHNSLSIHMFSSEEPLFQHLSNISIQTTLHRALIGCEDIIRQHKSACLKISALLAVQDKVWIGTSAGIICVLDSNGLQLEIVPNGHTGHVRFLTAIQTTDDSEQTTTTTDDESAQERGRSRAQKQTLVISGGDGIEVYSRRVCATALTSSSATHYYDTRNQAQAGGSAHTGALTGGGAQIVTGGGGQCVGVGGASVCVENGREDSTNHLLLWQLTHE